MRRRLGLLGAWILVLVAGCSGAPTASHRVVPPPSSSGPQVDLKVTPPGWVPVAYGNLQISVPPTWIINGGCSVDGQGSIYFGSTPKEVCFARGNFVVLSTSVPVLPASPASSTNGLRLGIGGWESINGIRAYRPGTGDNTLVVPSLGGSVDALGPLAGEVSNTLTASSRAVALAPGPAPTIPKSWHRLSYGGISVAVPQNWPVNRPAFFCPQPGFTLQRPAVTLDSGNTAPPCPPPVALVSPVQPAADGVVIDSGPIGPITNDTTFGHCVNVNDLSVCPTTSDLYGVLVASARLPTRSTPVAIEIGLAGDGMTARTILRSLRAG